MSRLLEEFNIKKNIQNNVVNDYTAFKDKNLLDDFRLRILEDLSDKGLIEQYVNKDLINSEIDDITYGYDLSNQERSYLFHLIDGEVNGYGPITELLNDDNITEIMVNSPNEVFVEIDGKIERDMSVSFINDRHIIRTIERLVEPSGKTIDVNKPMVDARLKDGSRFNAIIPPLSDGPVMTIRKFRKNIVTMEDLIRNGTLTPYMARFLEAAVKAKLNIIISGAAGAGKTSVLNILGEYIDDKERIITIEDVRELRLNKSNLVSLETRSANYDWVGEVTMRSLVRNAMRMRPDRIIVGEVRGNEAYDMLQVMNTGHDGSITTIHANNVKDAMTRLETMVLMDGLEVPIRAMREYINNAIDLVVHIARMRDGRRKITNISELVGVKNEELVLKTIFDFRNEGLNDKNIVQGEFVLEKYVPKVLDKIRNEGIYDLDDIFKKSK